MYKNISVAKSASRTQYVSSLSSTAIETAADYMPSQNKECISYSPLQTGMVKLLSPGQRNVRGSLCRQLPRHILTGKHLLLLLSA